MRWTAARSATSCIARAPSPAPDPSVGRRHRIVVKVDVTVGLRPQTDSAADRHRQRVLEIALAVEIALDLAARDLEAEVVPGARRGRRIANPFHRRALALLELP